MGLRAGLDRCGKSHLHRDSIPGPSSPYAVAKPSELPGGGPIYLPNMQHMLTEQGYVDIAYKSRCCKTFNTLSSNSYDAHVGPKTTLTLSRLGLGMTE